MLDLLRGTGRDAHHSVVPSCGGETLAKNMPQDLEDGLSVTRDADQAVTKLAGGQAPPAVTRITVSLVRKAAADLRAATERTGLSQTDIVNRALTLYQFIDSELESGAELTLRKDGRDHIVKLL